jgi:hypothetical protein
VLVPQVVPATQAFVQHDAAPGAPPQAPFVQVEDDASYRHPFESCMQLPSSAVDAQVGPMVPHTGSVAQAQGPDPVQVWCAGHWIWQAAAVPPAPPIPIPPVPPLPVAVAPPPP